MLDYPLFHAINSLAGRWPLLDETFRFFANDYIVPSALVAMLVWAWGTRTPAGRQTLIIAILSLALANLVIALCNALYFRPRPFTTHEVNLLFYYPSDSSFPSNSAAVVWSLGWAVWCYDRAWGRAALLLAALMGFSRLWVGIHYPLDIIGGAAIGILVTTLVYRYRDALRPLTQVAIAIARRLYLT